jgi:beta-glucosidase
LCGRNFEYLSEDPYLSGELATAWIDGIQNRGVGCSLKHFAANSRERERMSSDSIVDERTLREIYLPAFEAAVKNGRPATVMCAYNKLDGVYCSDHRRLLRDILRKEWGFAGVIVSDWGATNDRVEAFEAGLDLEMPDSKKYFDAAVIDAVRRGALAEGRIDESVDRLLELIFARVVNPGATDHDPREVFDRHHRFAQRIAIESAVLLKNEGRLLPIGKEKTIALIGAFAETPRYQGAGSSHINPTILTSALDGFDETGVRYTYFAGYPLEGGRDETLIAEAVSGAGTCDVAVVFAGLPDSYESEGFDRTDLAMPASHNELIVRVAEANPNTVVVLLAGSPVEMEWIGHVRAVLDLYLPGQAGGSAAAELLTGAANPSGKLAETYPLRYEDVPSSGYYETGGKQAQYREGLYVGYRYYDTAHAEVLFPFGHGLSYTTFEYSDLDLPNGELGAPYTMTVSATVTNSGETSGAEVAQLYVSTVEPSVFRPEKELKGFAKVFLEPGESKRVRFELSARSFAVYDVRTMDWVVPEGEYRILVGASSRDIRLQAQLIVHGPSVEPAREGVSKWYYHPTGRPTQADFASLLGRSIEPPPSPRKGEYTTACSFADMKERPIIRLIMKGIERSIGRSYGRADLTDPTYRMIIESVFHMPLKNLSQTNPESMPGHVIEGVVRLANGRLINAILAFAKRTKRGRSREVRKTRG